MERIELDVERGSLTVKYSYNKLKRELLRPFSLRETQSKDVYETSLGNLDNLISLVKERHLYLKLSKSCQEMTGLNEHGYSQDELEIKSKMWVGHPSYVSETPDDFDPSDYGLTYGKNPFPYQAAGIAYGVKVACGRVLVADQMGLGKTLQSIAIASYYRDCWPLVIVSPASLVYNWKKEICQWLDWVDADDIHVMTSGEDKPKGLVTVCSYHYLHSNLDDLVEFLNVRGVVIFDEAHSLKNLKSLRGAAGQTLAHHAKKCMMVTGTPILNRPIEMFSLLNCINPIEWNSEEDFARQYCEGHWQELPNKTRIYYDKGASHLDDLMARARNTCMFRRLKKDVLHQLPPKRRYPITLNTCKEDGAMDAFMDLVRVESIPLIEKHGFDVQKIVSLLRGRLSQGQGSGIFQAYQRSGIAKAPHIVNYISDQLDSHPDEPLIVFVHHQAVLNEIEESLVKNHSDIGFIKIDGNVADKKKRFEMAERFQTDPSCKVALLTIGAASVGLTLTKASRVIMGEMPWTPNIAMQAEDRAHRIGQESDVDIVYLLGNNGFDDYLWSTLFRKSDASNEALDGLAGELFEASDDEEREFSDLDLLTSLVESLKEDYDAGLLAA